MDHADTKTCTECKRALASSEFPRNRRTRSGLHWACKQCNSARAKAWRDANKARTSAYNAAYYSTNRERISADRETRRQADPEAKRKQDRAYAARNRERRRQQSREWYTTHAGTWAEYNRRRRAALKSQTSTRISMDDLIMRMSMFGHRCWMCGGPFEHVDHVKPLSKGGAHMLCNLRPACAACNHSKKARWPFDTRLGK